MKLEPCPYCNSKKIFIDQIEKYIRAYCGDCLAEGPPTSNEEKAGRLWNMRLAEQRFFEVGQFVDTGAGKGKILVIDGPNIKIKYENNDTIWLTIRDLEKWRLTLAHCLL